MLLSFSVDFDMVFSIVHLQTVLKIGNDLCYKDKLGFIMDKQLQMQHHTYHSHLIVHHRIQLKKSAVVIKHGDILIGFLVLLYDIFPFE